MLIVIVIIGILSASIFPRVNGILAKSRDTSRQIHLNQIASVISLYQTDTGQLPFFSSGGRLQWCENEHHFFRNASDLAKMLPISQIPLDPQKSNRIDNICVDDHKGRYASLLTPWEYLYTLQRESSAMIPIHNWDTMVGTPIALVIAKVETPSVANYMVVSSDPNYTDKGRALAIVNGNCINALGSTPARIWPQLDLCSSVEKSDTASRSQDSDGN